MPSPPIQVFLTTIASQPALRQRQEYLLRILQVKKILFTSYDLASDETAKRLWKRKVPLDKQQLPGILVGGKFPGTFSDFEEAVEYAELNKFLRLDEEYNVEEDPAAPPVQPVGVPGASSPQQMTNQKPSFAASPSPLRNKNVKEFDMGEELPGFGLQGLKVTDYELADLVKDLGLEGDEAGDLVKGLSSTLKAEELVTSQSTATPEQEEIVEKELRGTTVQVESKPTDRPSTTEVEPQVDKASVGVKPSSSLQ